LDGLRAVAILLVLLEHGLVHADSSVQHGLVRWFSSGRAGDGVQIFFVISGFLITTLLLREEEKFKRISLRNFFVRRAFRILPPLYVYLIILSVIAAVRHLELPQSTLLSCFLLFRDYSTAPAFWATDNIWSVSVEEHFYLLWPLLLVALLRVFGSKRGRTAAALVAIALAAASPLMRILEKLYGNPLHSHRINFLLHTRLDGLMIGCLLALTIGTPLFERIYAAAARFWWLCPVYLLLLQGHLEARFGVYYLFLVGLTVESLAIGLFLVWAVRNPLSGVGRLLNSKPVAYMGVLSYSLYIWQMFFIVSPDPTLTGGFPYSIGGLVVAALMSYYLVEQPSLRLRDRFLRKPGESKSVGKLIEPTTAAQ
jgi:peptidoglycan/LPS O-acetylase OafA/YrhL